MYKLNELLYFKNVLLILFVISFLSTSCSRNNTSDQKSLTPYTLTTPSATDSDTLKELTPEQQSAFDALNTLQVSTNEMNRFYSTVAGIVQSCYPPDTVLTITQAELLTSMKQFVSSNCSKLTAEMRNEIANVAVLAQEEYTLYLCLEDKENANFNNRLPMAGTWILPNILNRRDLIIVW